MTPFRCGFDVEGLNAWRVAEKVSAAGVPVLRACRTAKNGIYLEVAYKDRKKVFAILRGSCYNVKRVRPRGLSRAVARCAARAGLLVGAAMFALLVPLVQTRVLKIDVVGSGAYYEREVLEILAREGVSLFSGRPREFSSVRAQVLALPRVSFCSVRAEGGVLTVDVEVSDEAAPLAAGALYVPVSGTVEELIVVRGTAAVAVGDAVSAGDVAVDNGVWVGETRREVYVIAEIKVAFPVAREYPLSEAGALSQAALDYGELTEIHTEKTENGWLVAGTAHRTAARNLG